MGTVTRPADRGRERGLSTVRALGREIRLARRERGLSLELVGRASGLSRAQVSRIERGLVPGVPLSNLAVLGALVGLDLSARMFPTGSPLRDAAHVALLQAFAARLHRSLRWSTEVPLPIPGDGRAWDGFIRGRDWTVGVEAETAPSDHQAIARRLMLKRRDGLADHVVLLLPDTVRARAFVREAGDSLRADFPVPGQRALELLGAAVSPGGDSVVVLPQHRAATQIRSPALLPVRGRSRSGSPGSGSTG